MKKGETKKEIREYLSLYVELSSVIKGSLQDVANNILNIETRLRTEHGFIRENPNYYIRFEIEIETYYEDTPEIKLFGIRLESDAEFNQRIDRNKKARIAEQKRVDKQKEEKEKKELQTYLRLKTKFEKNTNINK